MAKVAQERTKAMARSHKKQSKAVAEFVIPSVRKDMDEDTWEGDKERIVWYGIPEGNRYRHPEGGRYKRCRIPVFDSKEFLLGYVPLPSKYRPAWERLCKNIAFRLCEWKLWVAESKKQLSTVPEDVCTELRRDSGTKLLQYMAIRRMIVGELLQTKMDKEGKDELDVFDEYLIRDAYDWLWTDRNEIPQDEEYLLGLDPFDKSNEDVFPPNYLPDKVHDSREWTRGLIPGYEEERPWIEGGEAPSVWHEGQEPVVSFLSEEEDALTETRARESSDRQIRDAQEQERSSRQHMTGSNEGNATLVEEDVDGNAQGMGEVERDRLMGSENQDMNPPQTSSDVAIDPAIIAEESHRRLTIINDYAQGKIEIPATEERIKEALGHRYDYILWGKAIQQVYREAEVEEERGTLTVDEMFAQFIVSGQERLDNLDKMRNRQTRL
ncbi:hypothetical protein J3R83DRAFT_10939 [Lanmaoa asiatica]|nr:hypothetical protein J3R83DRAFT_10939 [Lanmaoa asiatica]